MAKIQKKITKTTTKKSVPKKAAETRKFSKTTKGTGDGGPRDKHKND